MLVKLFGVKTCSSEARAGIAISANNAKTKQRIVIYMIPFGHKYSRFNKYWRGEIESCAKLAVTQVRRLTPPLSDAG